MRPKALKSLDRSPKPLRLAYQRLWRRYRLPVAGLGQAKNPEVFMPQGPKMVEMAGVEPASESISNGLSPSAASDLLIRLGSRPKAGCCLSYPVSPLCCRAFT